MDGAGSLARQRALFAVPVYTYVYIYTLICSMYTH